MNKWLFNSIFPGTLYRKVNNITEYIESLNELKNPIEIKAKYYDEILDIEIFPFKGDIDLFKETFCINQDVEEFLDKESIKLKPEDSDYPVMLIYKHNYNDFYWIPLSE